MRSAIIQSSYIPWRGYFDFINSVDVFIVFDDISFGSKRNWRHRNMVKTTEGLKWITVPVMSKRETPVDEVKIGGAKKPWQDSHRRLLKESLGPAPYFNDAMALWEEGVLAGDETISALNVRLMRLICDYLGISTPLVMSSDYGVSGAKTERLINLLKAVGASAYLSGPTARGYLEEDMFRANGIRLEYKSYDYPVYPQLWGEFAEGVTVLDLIANTGPDANKYLKSRTPDEVAVP